MCALPIVSLFAALGAVLLTSPAFAQSATPWDRCISPDAGPAERIAACTA